MERARNVGCATAGRPIVSKIVNKWQITVPVEIRALYGLKEGDLFEWRYDERISAVVLIPKRAELITPVADATVRNIRRQRQNSPEAQKTYA